MKTCVGVWENKAKLKQARMDDLLVRYEYYDKEFCKTFHLGACYSTYQEMVYCKGSNSSSQL